MQDEEKFHTEPPAGETENLRRKCNGTLACVGKVKVKGNKSLCLIKHQAVKMHWGSAAIGPRILNCGTKWR